MRFNNQSFFTKVASILFLLSLIMFVNSTSGDTSVRNLSVQEELDQYIQTNVNKLNIPGMSVAISHNDDIVYSQTFGMDITSDTRFFIGSTSKPFTALAVMQLVEQEKIGLDESVSTYIEEFTVSDEITVRHLLHHISGMTSFDYQANLPPNASFLELVHDMNNMSLTFAPGEHFSYFNPNYSLLGFIIERVSGQSFTTYIEDHIIKPLELEHTSVRGKVDTPGHLSFFGFSIEHSEQFIEYDLPAGFLTSTPEDVVRYLEAIRMRKPAVGVSPQRLELMESDDLYGMGWMTFELAGRSAVHHGGSLPGYASEAIMLVEDEYSISVLINKNHMLNVTMFYQDLANGIISILTEQEPPLKANYYWIYRLLVVLFAFTLVSNIAKVVKLIKYPGEKTIKQRITSAIINLAIPIVVVIVIPIIIESLLQRGMSWKIGFLLMPDFLTWLFVGLASNLIVSAIHFAFIAKHHFNKAKTIN